eukprot:g5347.t1
MTGQTSAPTASPKGDKSEPAPVPTPATTQPPKGDESKPTATTAAGPMATALMPRLPDHCETECTDAGCDLQGAFDRPEECQSCGLCGFGDKCFDHCAVCVRGNDMDRPECTQCALCLRTEDDLHPDSDDSCCEECNGKLDAAEEQRSLVIGYGQNSGTSAKTGDQPWFKCDNCDRPTGCVHRAWTWRVHDMYGIELNVTRVDTALDRDVVRVFVGGEDYRRGDKISYLSGHYDALSAPFPATSLFVDEGGFEGGEVRVDLFTTNGNRSISQGFEVSYRAFPSTFTPPAACVERCVGADAACAYLVNVFRPPWLAPCGDCTKCMMEGRHVGLVLGSGPEDTGAYEQCDFWVEAPAGHVVEVQLRAVDFVVDDGWMEPQLLLFSGNGSDTRPLDMVANGGRNMFEKDVLNHSFVSHAEQVLVRFVGVAGMPWGTFEVAYRPSVER